MKYHKIIIVLLVIAFFVQNVFAQKGATEPRKDRFEFGIFVGATNYQGDLEENAVNINYTQLGYGGLVRYNINNKFSLRFGMDYGSITDADSAATTHWRQKRNLSFRSDILDGYLAAEFYFASWSVGYKTFLSPYIFAGLGVFSYNPQAYYQGNWYDLQPLGTEGQGTLAYPDRQPYSLTQLYVPFGGGLRINLGQTWWLALEVKGNKTFTDYLDDVSTTYVEPEVLLQQHGYLSVALADRSNERAVFPPVTGGHRGGTTNNTDWYFFTGITLSHTFKSKSPCYSF